MVKLDNWRKEFFNIFSVPGDLEEGSLAQLATALGNVVNTLSCKLHGYVAARTTILSKQGGQAARLEASLLRALAYSIIERPHDQPGAGSGASKTFDVDETVKATLISMISNGEIGAALLFKGESFANNRHQSQDVKEDVLTYWKLCVQFRNTAKSLWVNNFKAFIQGDNERNGIELFIRDPYLFDNSQWMVRLLTMDQFWPVRDFLGTSVLHVLLQELGRRRSQGDAEESPDLARRIALHCQNKDKDPPDRLGRLAIHIAAQYNLPDVVQALLNAGKEQDRRERWSGRTALHFAAALGHLEVCETLLWQISDQQSKDNPEVCKVSAVRISARQSGDLNLVDKYGRVPLHYACRLGHVEVVKTLLRRRDILANIPDRWGDTPLMAALQSERSGHHLGRQSQDWRVRGPLVCPADIESETSAFKELLRHPWINPNLANHRKDTALHIAVSQNNLEAVRQLASKCSASINSKDADGRTALCCAARQKWGDLIVKTLLGVKGVDPSIPDSQGKTALDYALLKGNTKIHYLLSSHAKNASKVDAGNGADGCGFDGFQEKVYAASLAATRPPREAPVPQAEQSIALNSIASAE